MPVSRSPITQAVPAFSNFLDELDRLSETTKAFSGRQPQFPELSSAGRAYVLVGGKPIALTQNIQFRVSLSPKEIRTIDTALPWSVYATQIQVQASLSQLVDPKNSAEAQGLFHTMASAIHQPLVELEVFDKIGTRLFFARGMFYDSAVTMTNGQLSVRSCSFVGSLYAHNVKQSFKPYAGGAEQAIRDFAAQAAAPFTSVGL